MTNLDRALLEEVLLKLERVSGFRVVINSRKNAIDILSEILSSIHVDKVQTSERFDGFSPIPWQCRLSFSKDASSWMVLSVAEFAFAYPSDFLRAPNLRFGLVYNDKSEQFVKLAKTCGCYNSGGAMPVGNFGR